MTKLRQLSELGRVTETVLVAAQSRMQKLKAAEEELNQQLHDLTHQKTLSPEQQVLARQVGADVKWQRWVDQRREHINEELLRVMIQKEQARQSLQQAFGKDQALRALLRKERMSARLNVTR